MQYNDGPQCPLDEKSILLKGSTLRNTEWVIGIAVFTGHDTKIMKNSASSKVKLSKNQRALNRYILICMVIQLLCSVVGAIIGTIKLEDLQDYHTYLFRKDYEEKKAIFVSIL